MAFKIEIVNTALSVTNTVSGDIEVFQPSTFTWYQEDSLKGGFVKFYGITDQSEKNTNKYEYNKVGNSFNGYPITDCTDSNDVVFTAETFRTFASENLGKPNGGSSSETTIERLVNGASTDTSQEPAGLGEAGSIQIKFGPAQNTISDPVQLLDDGSLVFNEGGMYRLKITLIFGRLGGAGESELRFRALVNGVQAGQSIGAEIDSQRIEIPYSDEAWLNIPAGAVITYEVMRDSSGNDSGGLFQPFITPATAPNWNSTTCAAIRVERFV